MRSDAEASERGVWHRQRVGVGCLSSSEAVEGGEATGMSALQLAERPGSAGLCLTLSSVFPPPPGISH